MNIAFEISPLLAASGIAGSKSGIYRSLYNKIFFLSKFIKRNNLPTKIYLFTFNPDLLKKNNNNIDYLLKNDNIFFLNQLNDLNIDINLDLDDPFYKFYFSYYYFYKNPLIHLFYFFKKKIFLWKKNQENKKKYLKYLEYLKNELKKNNVKIIHHSETGFYYLKGFKNVLTIHDLTPIFYPHFHQKETIDLFKRKLYFALNFCDGIICISNHTKVDLEKIIKHFNLKKRIEIKTIYNPVEYKKNFKPEYSIEKINNILKTNLKKNNFFLYYGTFEPRKNLINLVKAFNLLLEKKFKKFKLLLVGGKGWGGTWKDVENFIKENLLNKKESSIIQYHFLNDKILESLIYYSKAVIYPTFYEGFGFQIPETLRFKKPIIISDNSSLKEITNQRNFLNKYVFYIKKPFNDEEIKKAIEFFLDNEKNNKNYEAEEKIIEKYLKNFSPEKISKELFDFYYHLINSNK